MATRNFSIKLSVNTVPHSEKDQLVNNVTCNDVVYNGRYSCLIYMKTDVACLFFFVKLSNIKFCENLFSCSCCMYTGGHTVDVF
jgi:hypothetical protein